MGHFSGATFKKFKIDIAENKHILYDINYLLNIKTLKNDLISSILWAEYSLQHALLIDLLSTYILCTSDTLSSRCGPALHGVKMHGGVKVCGLFVFKRQPLSQNPF